MVVKKSVKVVVVLINRGSKTSQSVAVVVLLKSCSIKLWNSSCNGVSEKSVKM